MALSPNTSSQNLTDFSFTLHLNIQSILSYKLYIQMYFQFFPQSPLLPWQYFKLAPLLDCYNVLTYLPTATLALLLFHIEKSVIFKKHKYHGTPTAPNSKNDFPMPRKKEKLTSLHGRSLASYITLSLVCYISVIISSILFNE